MTSLSSMILLITHRAAQKLLVSVTLCSRLSEAFKELLFKAHH